MKRMGKLALGLLGAACLLTADAWCAWTLATRKAVREAPAPAFDTVQADPLESFRTQRQELRAREEAELNGIIYAPGVDEAQAAQARARLMELMARAEAEATIEGVLAARALETPWSP